MLIGPIEIKKLQKIKTKEAQEIIKYYENWKYHGNNTHLVFLPKKLTEICKKILKFV